MFAKFKDIFAKRNKELRKRILFTLACLAIFIIGTNVRVPGTTENSNLGLMFRQDMATATDENNENFIKSNVKKRGVFNRKNDKK